MENISSCILSQNEESENCCRTEIHLLSSPGHAVEESIRTAEFYAGAGCDCLQVSNGIQAVVKAYHLPIEVIKCTQFDTKRI